MSKTIATLGLWMFFGLAAQAQEATRPVKMAPPGRLPEPVTAPVISGTPVATATLPRTVRRAVVADAARRFNVAESAVVLAGAEQVTWNDGALGCAEPGMLHTQALVPGYRLTAKTQSGQLLYHTDERGRVVHCGQPGFQPGKKTLPAKPQGTGAEPRTDPAAKPAPDR